MANKTLYITVNTAEDFIKPRQGLTTLRQAIVKLNEKQGNWDRAYINFDLSNADSAFGSLRPNGLFHQFFSEMFILIM